jgi:putative SOS response-associated peptidase YedK
LYLITTNQAAIGALFRVMDEHVGNLPPPPRGARFPATNIRNTSSPHWRGWLKPEIRCLVPADSFAAYAPEPDPNRQERPRVVHAR